MSDNQEIEGQGNVSSSQNQTTTDKVNESSTSQTNLPTTKDVNSTTLHDPSNGSITSIKNSTRLANNLKDNHLTHTRRQNEPQQSLSNKTTQTMTTTLSSGDSLHDNTQSNESQNRMPEVENFDGGDSGSGEGNFITETRQLLNTEEVEAQIHLKFCLLFIFFMVCIMIYLILIHFTLIFVLF